MLQEIVLSEQKMQFITVVVTKTDNPFLHIFQYRHENYVIGSVSKCLRCYWYTCCLIGNIFFFNTMPETSTASRVSRNCQEVLGRCLHVSATVCDNTTLHRLPTSMRSRSHLRRESEVINNRRLCYCMCKQNEML